MYTYTYTHYSCLIQHLVFLKCLCPALTVNHSFLADSLISFHSMLLIYRPLL